MTFLKLFTIIYFFYTISSILTSHFSPHLTFPNLLLTVPLSYQICSTISISLASSLFLWLFYSSANKCVSNGSKQWSTYEREYVVNIKKIDDHK